MRGSPEVPHCPCPSKGNLKQVPGELILKEKGRRKDGVPAPLCLSREALSQEDLSLTTNAKDLPPCTARPLA